MEQKKNHLNKIVMDGILCSVFSWLYPSDIRVVQQMTMTLNGGNGVNCTYGWQTTVTANIWN